MAITPESITRHSAGSNTLISATFAADEVDDGETWTSNIPSVVGWWFNANDDPTQTKEKVDVTLTTPTTGVFTFHTSDADDRTGILHVLCKI